jgi:hypothetical protein
MAELEPEQEERTRRVPTGAVVAAGVAATLSALVFWRARHRARLGAHEEALERLAQEYGLRFIPSDARAPEGPDFPAM